MDQVFKGILDGANGTCTCNGERTMFVGLVGVLGCFLQGVEEVLDFVHLREWEKGFKVLLKGLVY
jgi:hypothetical protein